MPGRFSNRVIPFLLALALLAGCAPLSAPAAPDAAPAPTPTARPTFTPLPTLSPPPVTPTPAAATEAAPAAYAEPAGCLGANEQAQLSTADMLAYADQLLALETPLARRRLTRAWNASARVYQLTGEDALAFSTSLVQNRYLVQEMLNALHAAGFAAWLRQDAQAGEHILAVPMRAAALQGAWAAYIRAYWQPGELPAGDASVVETLRLSPCRWMVASGLAPDVPVGQLEGAGWQQPDFASSAQAFLAADSPSAFAVARGIAWLDGKTESPALMCGPLAWAITSAAGAFPPGYGAWDAAPKSFWLPKPSENGRPWSLFPPDTYTLRRFSEPLGSADLIAYPLEAGDLVYTYSKQDGFDHVLVVSEVDSEGNRFAVTNLTQVKPRLEYSIRRILLYSAKDPTVGYFRNQWANDRVNGRTGDGGFEVFRWAWRAKDLSGQPARYTVRPGDSLPLVAARWKTPPGQIASANGLDPSAPLRVGQELIIPVNP